MSLSILPLLLLILEYVALEIGKGDGNAEG
jgi:hypothetical protein